MIIYQGVKTSFIDSVERDTIAPQIDAVVFQKTKRHVSPNEYRSWENSMQYMYKVLSDAEIPSDAGIAIEYNIPQTSKRVDFMISGYDDKQNGSVVIVELKQWDSIRAVDGKDGLVETYTGGGIRQVVHPSYQAWSYATLIRDYNETVWNNGIELFPCAYLHNYQRVKNDPLDAEQYKEYLEDAPAFSRGEVFKIRAFIKKSIVTGDNMDLIYRIDSGKIRPSKSLQDAICGMVKCNREFTMIDDQKVVYEHILSESRNSVDDNHKRVVIVEGGPGTGKTVIAINLLAQLTRENQFCQYVSKNSAPRNVYAKKLKGSMRKSSIDNMFKGSGIYVDAPESVVDTIIVDEAHRLNSKSGMFHNLGENQIKEIIAAAKCSVFFIDESQRITLNDIGSIAEIERWAEYWEADVSRLQLHSQFRCNGSDGYLAWLDDSLEIRSTANYDLSGTDYDFRVIDSPTELYEMIVEKNKFANKSRLLAGYCWDWISTGKNDTTVHDIVIGDFEMSWNLGNSSTWAIDEKSVNEIGCIHTSQGLEFDYVGVIIGEDLRYENGHVITDFTKRASTDQSLKGIKKKYSENPLEAYKLADEIIRNTYRTLMTRGMKGCYIFCVDKGLQEYFKERIENV